MKTVTEHLRNRILERAGIGKYYKNELTPDQIRDQEFHWDFVGLMLNRMVQGYFRYGPVKDDPISWVAEAKKRIELYEITGNKEYLVDAGNGLGIEFTYPKHPEAHFEVVHRGEDGKGNTTG